MSDVNLYFYIEDLNLTTAQRAALIAQLQAIAMRDADPNPRNRNHWRIRSDGKAVIYEAWWNAEHLTAVAMRNRLAAIFGVSNTSITYASASSTYGTYVDYSYSSTKRLRVGIFGGISATYAESQAAARAYLASNRATWEGQA